MVLPRDGAHDDEEDGVGERCGYFAELTPRVGGSLQGDRRTETMAALSPARSMRRERNSIGLGPVWRRPRHPALPAGR